MAVRLLLLALLLAAPAPTDPAGHYRLREGPDVVSQLDIRRDGTFEYGLIAGALDEYATGRWRRVAGGIRLSTVPKPVPPAFSAGPAGRTADAPLRIHVLWPDGRDAIGTGLVLDFASGPPLDTYIGGPDGWTLPAGETRRPIAVTLALRMFGFTSPRFPIDAARANDLTFVITPHDLGRVDFEDLPLDVLPDRLVMHRGGGALTYERQR